MREVNDDLSSKRRIRVMKTKCGKEFEDGEESDSDGNDCVRWKM